MEEKHSKIKIFIYFNNTQELLCEESLPTHPCTYADTLTHLHIQEYNIIILYYCKGHSCSPGPQKNVHNFSLEGPTIFLPA